MRLRNLSRIYLDRSDESKSIDGRCEAMCDSCVSIELFSEVLRIDDHRGTGCFIRRLNACIEKFMSPINWQYGQIYMESLMIRDEFAVRLWSFYSPMSTNRSQWIFMYASIIFIRRSTFIGRIQSSDLAMSRRLIQWRIAESLFIRSKAATRSWRVNAALQMRDQFILGPPGCRCAASRRLKSGGGVATLTSTECRCLRQRSASLLCP